MDPIRRCGPSDDLKGVFPQIPCKNPRLKPLTSQCRYFKIRNSFRVPSAVSTELQHQKQGAGAFSLTHQAQ